MAPEKLSVLGFVPIGVVGLMKDVWFRMLDLGRARGKSNLAILIDEHT
jgi:hypothetical protein